MYTTYWFDTLNIVQKGYHPYCFSEIWCHSYFLSESSILSSLLGNFWNSLFILGNLNFQDDMPSCKSIFTHGAGYLVGPFNLETNILSFKAASSLSRMELLFLFFTFENSTYSFWSFLLPSALSLFSLCLISLLVCFNISLLCWMLFSTVWPSKDLWPYHLGFLEYLMLLKAKPCQGSAGQQAHLLCSPSLKTFRLQVSLILLRCSALLLISDF